MINWVFLIIAGILEIGWVISLKYTDGFTKFIPILFYGFFGLTSAYFFSHSLKSIPLGVAYSIWMGIAVLGTVIYEVVVFQKSYTGLKSFFIILILLGIIGLKLVTKTE